MLQDHAGQWAREEAGQSQGPAHGRNLSQELNEEKLLPMENVFIISHRLTYKDGYANTVRREAEKDIIHIQEQYQGIIDILKQKIQ